MELPITKLTPFYAGQLGIPGSDNPLGMREWPQSLEYYVDYNNPIANDASDGTGPHCPLATVQEAVDRLEDANVGFSVIKVRSMTAESVHTYDYGDGPSFVLIQGMGNPFGSKYSPYWESDVATLPCLDLNAPGFIVRGFCFAAPTTSSCITLHHTDVTGNDIAIHTIIEDNYFYGQTTGRYGILTHGCYEVVIRRNKFFGFHNARGAVAIRTDTCPLAIPYRNEITDNLFQDNDNHINGEFNGCLFARNVFQVNGISYAADSALHTAGGVGGGGARNIVTDNFFEGIYKTVAGGGNYTATANDWWMGNHADPATETAPGTTVHACGLTIARPAA